MQFFKNHAKKLIALVVVLALLGLGGYIWHTHEAKKEKEAADKAAAQGPSEVVVRTMKKQAVPVYEELPGRTTAHKVSEIRPQVAGIINGRLFEEGSDVQAGQQLYQINPAPFQAVLNSTKADLLKAQANMQSVASKAKRYQELVKVHAISQQEYDDTIASYEQAKADIAIAQAAVETAQINLDFTRVYAPISGRVGKSNVTEGALVTAGQADSLATITQLDPIFVDLTQSSKALIEMRDHIGGKEKTTVTLIVEDRKDSYKHDGEVQFSDVTVDPTTGMVQLRAIFPNPEHDLLPGLFVRARVHLDTLDAILLPQRAAIRNPDGGLSVWKVSADNKLSLVPIQTDRAVNADWVVSSGIDEGDIVVMSGFQKAAAGANVKTITEKEAADRAAKAKAKAEAEAMKKQDAATKPANKDGKDKDGDKADKKADDKKADKTDTDKDDSISVPPVKDDTSPQPAKNETGLPATQPIPQPATALPAQNYAPTGSTTSPSPNDNTVKPEDGAAAPVENTTKPADATAPATAPAATKGADKVPPLDYDPNKLKGAPDALGGAPDALGGAPDALGAPPPRNSTPSDNTVSPPPNNDPTNSDNDGNDTVTVPNSGGKP